VRHLGLLDRSAARSLQREADALLLLTGSDRSEATGKLYEYLTAERPILALASDNEAARIVSDTRTGLVVDPGDRAAIERALRELAERGLDSHHSPQQLERFVYPGPAQQMEQLVEEAIARRYGVHT
jgi:glycosyltransferase involved in cell wall biosynthesis